MKIFTLSLILMAGFGVASAQSLSPTVISSSGGFSPSVSGSPSLSYTIGEMTMVQTFTGSNSILTQGFQQPNDFPTAIPEPNKNESFAFEVFPNPSSGHIHLVLNTKTNASVNIRLFDALGKTVATDHFTHPSGVNFYSFNWDNLSSGMYMLEVITTDVATNFSQKSMKKLNIIY